MSPSFAGPEGAGSFRFLADLSLFRARGIRGLKSQQCPFFHRLPSLLKGVAATVGALGLILDRMREGAFAEFAAE
jgi:hypothetical protein